VGYLLHIVLALAALGAAEEGFTTAVEAPYGVLALALVPHVLAWGARWLVLHGRFRAAEVAYRALSSSAILLHVVATLAFGWPSTVERWLGVAPTLLGWPHPSALLALAPFFVYALLASDAKARLSDTRADEIARTRSFHARLLASSFAPFAVFVVATWAIGLDRNVRANVEHVAVWGGAFALALLLVTVAILPWLLRATLDTSPLPAGRTRVLLETFATAIRFRCSALVQWNTGLQMANAAVVGIGRGRVVLFSDLLLAQLPERELLAVFAHEIGHVVKHHVIVFAAWSTTFFVAVDLVLVQLALSNEWIEFAVLVAGLGLWYLGFGLLSRRTELEADLYSVGVTRDVEAMVAALERVGSPHTRALGSWRHFSTEKRVEFLRRATSEPEVAARLQRRMKRLARIGLALGCLSLCVEAWNLGRSYAEDRAVAELALGRYERAAEIAAGVEGLDEELAALLRRSATITPAQRTPEALVASGERAIAAADLRAGLEYLALARLRGAEGLEDVIEELDERLRTASR